MEDFSEKLSSMVEDEIYNRVRLAFENIMISVSVGREDFRGIIITVYNSVTGQEKDFVISAEEKTRGGLLIGVEDKVTREVYIKELERILDSIKNIK